MTWGSVLPAAMAAEAVAVARTVARRLAAPESLPPLPDRPALLRDGASGAAGCAVLLSRFDGSEGERAAHRCLTAAVRELEHADVRPPGMFDGLTGLAFSALLLSRNGTRYQRLLAELDRGIVRDATSRAAVLAHARHGLPFESFDLVSGITGTGAYLLRRNAYPAALRSALTGLVAVCRWDTDLPNWHTPAWSIAPKTPMAESFPGGVLNCGLAHGVPGPLALLSLAELSGISVPGQGEAIAVVGHWLAAHRADDAHGPNWPTGIPLPGTAAVETRSRNAWCYGGPGVARALWLAGNAIDDTELRSLAVEAMLAASSRFAATAETDPAPGLCHGVAGLLQIMLRFAHDTGDPRFARAAVELTDRLLARYDPAHRFGFRCAGELPADRPGLLDGAAGIALALLAASTGEMPDWDRMLLLA
ncbi:lanthionine synthetase C family protein [Nocardia brasiliensis]|uniref:lanthionine synthetase C family protein n=1 Tax=Nocardia brasiliensis TaxID=37326 RepID=UPI0009DB5461|nr:lanthionine synthetase C family protein [Nocardia brasiliensis]